MGDLFRATYLYYSPPTLPKFGQSILRTIFLHDPSFDILNYAVLDLKKFKKMLHQALSHIISVSLVRYKPCTIPISSEHLENC